MKTPNLKKILTVLLLLIPFMVALAFFYWPSGKPHQLALPEGFTTGSAQVIKRENPNQTFYWIGSAPIEGNYLRLTAAKGSPFEQAIFDYGVDDTSNGVTIVVSNINKESAEKFSKTVESCKRNSCPAGLSYISSNGKEALGKTSYTGANKKKVQLAQVRFIQDSALVYAAAQKVQLPAAQLLSKLEPLTAEGAKEADAAIAKLDKPVK